MTYDIDIYIYIYMGYIHVEKKLISAYALSVSAFITEDRGLVWRRFLPPPSFFPKKINFKTF
jgi:hypothetical protein